MGALGVGLCIGVFRAEICHIFVRIMNVDQGGRPTSFRSLICSFWAIISLILLISSSFSSKVTLDNELTPVGDCVFVDVNDVLVANCELNDICRLRGKALG